MYKVISKKFTYLSMLVFIYVILPTRSVFALMNATEGGEETTTQTPEPVYLENPLEGTVDSLPNLIKELLRIVTIIGTPIVAIAIIFAGFMLVAAQGNPEKLQKARQALLWAIVGGAIVLGSWVIAQAIGGTVEQLTN